MCMALVCFVWFWFNSMFLLGIGWYDTVIISCLVSNKYIWLYSSGFSISWYGYTYHVILCIGQLHRITVYRTGFLVCTAVVLRVIMCFFLLIIEGVLFHHDSCDYYWDFMAILYILNMFQLSVVVLVLQMCISLDISILDIPMEYLFEHVTLRLLYVMFRFSTRIFCGGVPSLQLIVVAMFGAVDKPLASCMFVHFF